MLILIISQDNFAVKTAKISFQLLNSAQGVNYRGTLENMTLTARTLEAVSLPVQRQSQELRKYISQLTMTRHSPNTSFLLCVHPSGTSCYESKSQLIETMSLAAFS